jgi:hypothetical protein
VDCLAPPSSHGLRPVTMPQASSVVTSVALAGLFNVAYPFVAETGRSRGPAAYWTHCVSRATAQ